MHFEISELKMILRSFDVLCLPVLARIGYFFDLDYLESSVTNRYRVLFCDLPQCFAAILKCGTW
jgi:hypothetical protein